MSMPGLLWRSLHATPVFHMKNDPVFGVVKADLFVRFLHPKDYTSAAIGLWVSSACKVLLQVSYAIFFSI